MKVRIILLFVFFMSINLFAQNPKDLANKIALNPATKAMMQWERIFKSERKMKRYKIDTLNKEEQKILKEYLISHAADSDKPQFAGDF